MKKFLTIIAAFFLLTGSAYAADFNAYCKNIYNGQDCGATSSVMQYLNCAVNATSVTDWDDSCALLTHGIGVNCHSTPAGTAVDSATCYCDTGYAGARCNTCASGYVDLGGGTCVAATSLIYDADKDTLVQTEETADDDTIRFDAGGSEVGTWTSTSFDIVTPISIDLATTPTTLDGFYIEHETITDNAFPLTIVGEQTHTEGRTYIGADVGVTSSAVVTTDNQSLTGGLFTAYKDGADTNTDTTSVAALWGQAANTGATDAGTKNTYGGFFQSVGDTAGTSTTYGVYTTASGADTNYSIYSAAGNVEIRPSAIEHVLIDTTWAPHTATDYAILEMRNDTATDNVTTMYLDSESTATTGNHAYSFQNAMTSSAVVTSGDQYLTASSIVANKLGADTNADTTYLYGEYVNVANTGSTDAGTKNTYAGTFLASGDTAGASTTYGLYVQAMSADTNYAYYGADGLLYNEDQALFGATANSAYYPNAQVIASNANILWAETTDHQGLVGEALAVNTVSDAQGVYGVAKSAGNKEGLGVFGKGLVTVTGDTASSVGVSGEASSTHAGGTNIGVRGSASAGAANYAFYGESGDMIMSAASSKIYVGGGETYFEDDTITSTETTGFSIVASSADANADIVLNAGDNAYIKMGTGNTQAIVIPSSSWVGLNTLTPASRLNIVQDLADVEVRLETHAAGVEPILGFYNSRGTEASPTATQSGDILGRITSRGYGASALVEGAKIEIVADENFTNTAAGSHIDIYTVDATATTQDKTITIDNDKLTTTGGMIHNTTAVAVGDTPYTVLVSDYILHVDTSGGAVTIVPPATCTNGQVWHVKDAAGTAAATNIIIDPADAVTIDGGLTYTINMAYNALSFYCHGNAYFAY